jgi:hypothetical protein
MSRTDLLIVLQGVGIAAQVINAGVGTVTHDPGAVLVVGAVVAGYQFVIQHLGNQTDPNRPQDPATK